MEEYRQTELKKIKDQFSTGEGANDEVYNPYVYRATPHGTNFLESTVHVIKASLGSGLLAMPSAFKNCGLWGGVIMTFIVGGVCTYTIHILVRENNPRRFFIEFFIIIYQTGISCVYIIFVAANFKSIMDKALKTSISIKIYILYLFIPFMLMLVPPNLKVLAPISLFANFVEFIIFFIILVYLVDDLPHISTVKAIASIEEQPLGLGTILFACAAIGAVTTIEKNMKNPLQFSAACGALNIAMLIIVIIYLVMGFFGFWKYGDATLGSITLNLQEKLVADIVQGMAMITIYMSFGLNAYVPVDIIWSHIEHKFEGTVKKWTYNYILRLFFVIFAFIVAIAVPLLDLCISLLGAFCMSLIQVVIPPVMDICINWSARNFGRYYWSFAINIFLICFGFIGLFCGTFTSVRDIVHALRTINDTIL